MRRLNERAALASKETYAGGRTASECRRRSVCRLDYIGVGVSDRKFGDHFGAAGVR